MYYLWSIIHLYVSDDNPFKLPPGKLYAYYNDAAVAKQFWNFFGTANSHILYNSMSGRNYLNFFHAKAAALYWALITHNINPRFGVREIGKPRKDVSGTLYITYVKFPG